MSDTHGLVRPEALAALKGSEVIVHAGDIGKAEVLDSFGSIAPVIAIKGNNDRDPWARKIPDVLNLEINGIKIHVIHNVNELEADPADDGIRVVVSGHSHKPDLVERDKILFINPGSAGPRRFKLPVAVGKLWINRGKVHAEIIELKI
ncbi:MAG TPA: metallophosphoesterase family protein [Candidatus Binatia bacterium]